MALPFIERERLNKLITEVMARKAPTFVQDHIQITTQIRNNKVAVIEERPCLEDPKRKTRRKVAQFEYSFDTLKWAMYCYDTNLKRRTYPNFSDCSLDELIEEVVRDPKGVFWG